MEGCSRLDAEAETAERMRALSTGCIPYPPRSSCSNGEVHQQCDVSSATHSDHPRVQLLYRDHPTSGSSSDSSLPLSSEADTPA